jgi:hypothetical protein
MTNDTIRQIQQSLDPITNKSNEGVVDLLLFDGTTSVLKAGEVLAVTFHCMTVVHDSDHVLSLFVKDVFTKQDIFKNNSSYVKRCWGIFGSTCHGQLAIFKKQSKAHNSGRLIGFIKPSECWMAGESIALLRCLQSKDSLRSNITSPKYVNNHQKNFLWETLVLHNNGFWKYVFSLCCSLYSMTCTLCLADQTILAMNKLYNIQSEKPLPKYATVEETDCHHILDCNKKMDTLNTVRLAINKYSVELDYEQDDDIVVEEDDDILSTSRVNNNDGIGLDDNNYVRVARNEVSDENYKEGNHPPQAWVGYTILSKSDWTGQVLRLVCCICLCLKWFSI